MPVNYWQNCIAIKTDFSVIILALGSWEQTSSLQLHFIFKVKFISCQDSGFHFPSTVGRNRDEPCQKLQNKNHRYHKTTVKKPE